MDPKSKVTGVCSGKHPKYRYMAAIVYSGGFTIHKKGMEKIESLNNSIRNPCSKVKYGKPLYSTAKVLKLFSWY